MTRDIFYHVCIESKLYGQYGARSFNNVDDAKRMSKRMAELGWSKGDDEEIQIWKVVQERIQ